MTLQHLRLHHLLHLLQLARLHVARGVTLMENGQGIHPVLAEHSHAHAPLLEQEHAQHLTVLPILKQVVLQNHKANHAVQQLHGTAEQTLAQHLLLLLTKLVESHAFLTQHVQQLGIPTRHRFLVNE